MTTRHVKTGLAILLGITCLGIVAMLLSPEPKVAWNDGAREKVAKALKAIAWDLAAMHAEAASAKVDPEDFIPRSVEHKVGSAARNGKLLAKQHGVSVRWRRNGVYENFLLSHLRCRTKLS